MSQYDNSRRRNRNTIEGIREVGEKEMLLKYVAGRAVYETAV